MGERMLRIGVTGHRSLTELDKINAGIKKALDRIARLFRDRSFTVVSSLAEGADRLVVHQALRNYPDSLLEVILPLPATEYQEHFSSRESKKEFQSLLNLAINIDELPEAPLQDAYLAAGRKILERCDVLIAIWDGKEARGRGGTGDIVVRARDQHLPILWIHAANVDQEMGQPLSMEEEQGSVTAENF